MTLKENPIFEIPFHYAITHHINTGDYTYTLLDFTQYDTHSEMTVQSIGDSDNDEHHFKEWEIHIPYDKDIIFQHFDLNGNDFVWDYRDNTLRYMPVIKDTDAIKINNCFFIYKDKAVWVEKEYAELNLSPLCITYSLTQGDGGYYWSLADHSAYTVILELYKLVAEYQNEAYPDDVTRSVYEILNLLTTYNCTYMKEFEQKYYIDSGPLGALSFSFRNYDIEKLYNREIKNT